MKKLSLKLMGIALLGLLSSQNCLADKKDKKNAASNAHSQATSDKSNAQSNAASDKKNAKNKASKDKSDNYVNVVISNNTAFPIKIKGSHLGKQHDTKSGIIKRTRVSKIYTQEAASDKTGKGATLIAAHGQGTYKLNTNKQYEYIAIQVKANNKEVHVGTKHGNDFSSSHTWTVTSNASGVHAGKKGKDNKKASAKSNAHSAAESAEVTNPTAKRVKANTTATPGVSNVRVTPVAKANAMSNTASNDNSLSGSGM